LIKVKASSCSGLHCPGCGDGGGPVIGLIIALVVVALIAAKARAISHALADLGHVLVLVAIAGAAVAVAAVAITGAVLIHRRIRQLDRGISKMRATLTSHGYGELPEPGRAELPAGKADIPAKIYIHPPKNRVSR